MKLSDIAAKANVSKATASLVLNGKPGVSDTKRAEILKIMNESNYTRLRSPRKSSNQNKLKIRFVAGTNDDVILTKYQQPFFNELISFLTSEASNKNLSLIMSIFPKENLFNSLKEIEQEEKSAGIILLGTNLTSIQLRPLSSYFDNLIIIDTESSGIDCTTVTMNNFLGSYIMTQYLLKMGHKKIGYIKGQPRINNFFDRRRGFKAVLTENKIDPKELPIFHMKGMHFAHSDERHIDSLLRFANSVTAIFCENDYMALNLIQELQNNGISVPEDISVIGFDDIVESHFSTPQLTTIHVPLREIANETIRLVLHGLKEQITTRQQIFLNPKLIIRDSVQKIST